MVNEELSLRPTALAAFVGQSALKKSLGLMLSAAKLRSEPLDHVAFYGPPGLGKTTLAGIIAHEMGGTMREIAAPALQKPGDLAALVASLSARDVLFLDEIHRLRADLCELLYTAMEDFKFTIQRKDEPAISLPLERFTLVGATTDFGLLPGPLRDRFGASFALQMYAVQELEQVILGAADKLDLLCDLQAARLLAERSRGTPRIALRLLRRARDMAQVKGDDLTLETAREMLDLLGIDHLGLEENDRRYLRTLVVNYGGGPAGAKSLSASSGIDEASILESIEPALLMLGLIRRTRRGREALPRGAAHVAPPEAEPA
jgi:Holliday junction DNA helicase RuvB